MLKQTNSLKWLGIALALCLIGALGAGLIQNSFGSVSITDVVIETDTGRLTGYLFKPATATDTNPASAIVTSHGYLNNREMQDINYVELSRRGYVVFAIDAYGHGDSSVAVAGHGSEISKTTGGMVDAVEYLSSLGFVDQKRIGITGHSMGGGFADATASYYTSLGKQALAGGATEIDAAKLNKVAAALIIGNVPAGLVKNHPYDTELGIIAGRYDEFFIVTLKQSVVNIFNNPTAMQLVSLQQGSNEAIRAGQIIEGQRYLNADTGFGVTMWSPWEIHPWNHFSTITAGHTIDFFQEYLKAPNAIPSNNQVWWVKEVFNLIGLVGFFLMLVPLADVLMHIPFFSSLKAQTPVTELKPLVKKGSYAGTSVFSALIGAILIIPLIALGFLWLVNPFWPQDTTGGIGLWAAGSGLITLLAVRMGGAKFIRNGAEHGTRISMKNLGKTGLLAFIIASLMFLTVFMADWLFKTDFRIWSFAVRAFDASKIWVALKYLPFFLVFFLANSLAVSRNRFTGWSKTKQIIVSIGWNILGMSLFLALQYIPLMINGMTFFGAILSGPLAAAGALFPVLVFPFIPILAIAAVVGVKLFDLTGNIYLSGFVNALVITMLTVANTAFKFPY